MLKWHIYLRSLEEYDSADNWVEECRCADEDYIAILMMSYCDIYIDYTIKI